MTVANGCNNNWKYWDIGTRTQFNVDSQTYVGLDVIYTKLQSATNGATVAVLRHRHAADRRSHACRPERLDGGIPHPSQLLSLIV